MYSCKNCRLLFLNPQPSGTELARHYPKNYYSLQTKEPLIERLLNEAFISHKKSFFLKILLLPFLPFLRTVHVVPGGRVLDVGCGSGQFLLHLKKAGMECHGVEPGSFNKKFAKSHGLPIFNGTLHQAKYPNNYFNSITMNHVFEHVEEPSTILEEIRRILKPGGTAIIGTPQHQCAAFILFGRYWVQLDVPRHLHVASSSNLRKYAKKTGFKIVKIRYNSTPLQFLGSLLYWTNNFRKKPKYLTERSFRNNPLLFLLFLPLAHICNWLRIGDQVEITLEK